MTCMISSQGLVLATAMVVSTSVVLLAFSKQFSGHLQPPTQSLRSCLTSGETKRKKKKKKTTKRVQFAETVKDTKGNGKEYRKTQRKIKPQTTMTTVVDKICRSEMPANRIALYTGILRDRGHRTECSY